MAAKIQAYIKKKKWTPLFLQVRRVYFFIFREKNRLLRYSNTNLPKV